MRKALRNRGFTLIAGEFPGGSDHELYPLNVVDPKVARDFSPDPRRHSTGELIPDIVALKGRRLVIGEAKVHYNEPDRMKLEQLIGLRRDDLCAAIEKFAAERKFPELLPVGSLELLPTLIFTDLKLPPQAPSGFSYIILSASGNAVFDGSLAVE
jgi:hypothetical protein